MTRGKYFTQIPAPSSFTKAAQLENESCGKNYFVFAQCLLFILLYKTRQGLRPNSLYFRKLLAQITRLVSEKAFIYGPEKVGDCQKLEHWNASAFGYYIIHLKLVGEASRPKLGDVMVKLRLKLTLSIKISRLMKVLSSFKFWLMILSGLCKMVHAGFIIL